MDPWCAKTAPRPLGRCMASLVLVQSAVSLIRSPASSLVPPPTCPGLRTSFAKTSMTSLVCTLALLDGRILVLLESAEDFGVEFKKHSLFLKVLVAVDWRICLARRACWHQWIIHIVTVTKLPANGISVCPQEKMSTFTLAASPWRIPHCASMTKSLSVITSAL